MTLTQERLKYLLRLEDGNLIWNHGQRMRNKVAGCSAKGKTIVRIDGKEYEKSRVIALYETGEMPPDPKYHKYNLSKRERVEAEQRRAAEMNKLITGAWV